uniref:NADH-ubiquinone oxidoreductase chain 5 n=1 Tax=Hemitheconyx caudicinctus TaxID=96741 RepID=I7H7M1_9SAUR|nr:NADH dehydrogenase subunit 5 [Hemitheconyx caudicinctus]BAM34430.1 NADH dehydrogenase subunit 5 [Hemitheconyx caudicinctus]
MQTLMMSSLALLSLAMLLPLPSKPGTTLLPLKLAFFTSLPPTLTFMASGLKSTTTNFVWLNSQLPIKISFTFDEYSLVFLTVALYVSWAILEFTNWYMPPSKNIRLFTKYLMTFLVSMLLLTTANNLFQLFIGWEGVGIMSFLLISWWFSRPNANTAALQAIIYNRFGDMGLLLTLLWLATNLNTWEIPQILSHKTTPTLPLLGLVLAATGKSAQFSLHPWLPAAMEGPTPVSALLHSSTMVIAGIFLLIRLNPLLQTNTTANTICLCLGAMTTIFTALCALTQSDIKKIIAFSTSSQLGLMMTAIGLNQPDLAFFHLLTHAFFKAMLFLCSGSIIHNLEDEQDIRNMGGIQKAMPITAACLTLGGLALIGTPFLAGFYSKDMIIESLNTSTTNAWALSTTLTATALTAAYTLRIIFYVQMGTPRFPTTSFPTEKNPAQINPLIRLALGSLVSGLLYHTTLLPTTTQTMTMPPLTKLAALLVTTLGLLTALELANKTMRLTTSPNKFHIFTSNLGFFNLLMHRKASNYTLQTAQTSALQLIDNLWYEKLGPMLISTTSIKATNTLSNLHKGVIKSYLAVFSSILLLIPIFTNSSI